MLRLVVFAAAVLAASSAFAQKAPPRLGDCAGDRACLSLEADRARAMQGDPVAQKKLAILLSRTGGGPIAPDPDLACAWTIVRLASGHPAVGAGDNGEIRLRCGRPAVAGLERPRALADDLFRKIHRRPLPPPPWGVVAPAEQVRLPPTREDFARFAISVQILAAGCPGARIDAKRIEALAARMRISEKDVSPGGALYPVMIAQGERLKTLEAQKPADPGRDCRLLGDFFGLAGRSLQGVVAVPAGPDYPN